MSRSCLADALGLLGNGASLTVDDCRDAVLEILDGNTESTILAAFLTALRMKGETRAELSGAVTAVTRRMVPLEVPAGLRPLLDTCGTGGDGANSINISTAAAIVVASCGVRVAKHGNRSASGNSGSAEVLSELGVKIDPSPGVLLRCLEEVGITFLFAPSFHPALKQVAPVRKQLPFRTIFNLIGPLVNPARPDRQVVGVPGRDQATLISNVLRDVIGGDEILRDREMQEKTQDIDVSSFMHPHPLNFQAFVVAGANGLDEVTLSGDTHVFRIRDRRREESRWTPADFGLPQALDAELAVSGPADSASKILSLLDGDRGPIRDVVLANAAASLWLVGKAESLRDGVAIGAEAIDSGVAFQLLERWAILSQKGD